MTASTSAAESCLDASDKEADARIRRVMTTVDWARAKAQAKEDLRSFLLARIKRAIQKGKRETHNRRLFAVRMWGVPYRQELEEVLGPDFEVAVEITPITKTAYVAIYW